MKKVLRTALVIMLSVFVTATFVPLTGAAYAADGDGQTAYQKDVQSFIDNADEEYAKYVTEYISYNFPSTKSVKTKIDGMTTMKYDPTGKSAYGFRGAGSAAELQCSKWLADEMKNIGLDVERDAVTLDGWEFKGATLTMNDEEFMDDPIISYMSSFNGTVDSELVYLGSQDPDSGLTPSDEGSGYEKWYERYYNAHGLTGKNRNMNGKIVVADINQDSSWITPFYMEAAKQGADGIITYSYQYCNADGSQEGTYWDHSVQVQDLCCVDYEIPCVAISRHDGLKIKKACQEAAKAGDPAPTAQLMVKSKVTKDTKAYNVVGTLKGTGNTGQRIVVSGHYDKYWYGYNDDNAAIGNVLATAKAMIDAGYKPINDIVFICHAAEEWGYVGAENDWAAGSYAQLTQIHPEWANTTLAMINFELPAMLPDTMLNAYNAENFKNLPDGTIGTVYACTPDVSETYETFLASDAMDMINASTGKDVKNVFKKYKAQALSDEIGWQYEGVPAYNFRSVYGKQDAHSIYHTPFDNAENYKSEAMDYDVKATAALAAKIDQTPAIQFSGRELSKKFATANYSEGLDREGADALFVDEYYNNYYFNQYILEELGLDLSDVDSKQILVDAYANLSEGFDTDAYNEAIAAYVEAGEAYLEKAEDINKAYTEAVEAGDTATAKAIYKKGIALNKKGLKVYKDIEDAAMVTGGSDTIIRSKDLWNNAVTLLQIAGYMDAENGLGPIAATYGYTLPYVGLNWANAAEAWACSLDVAQDYTYIADASAYEDICANRTTNHEACQVRNSLEPLRYAVKTATGQKDSGNVDIDVDWAGWAKTCRTEAKTLKSRMNKAQNREMNALNKAGEDATAAAAKAYKPSKATYLKATNVKTKKAKLTWKKTFNADKYTVAYKVKGAKSWKYKTVKSNKATLYKLTKGKTYQIKVRGVSLVKNTKGAWSTAKYVKIRK